MPRFLLGDELGHIKSLRYDPDGPTDAQDGTVSLKIITNTPCATRHAGVQCLAASPSDMTFAATFSDGSASAFHLDDDGNMEELVSWSEPRLKEHQRFVGLSVSNSTVFSCTSNGALRMMAIPREKADESSPPSKATVLPTRLRDWKLSNDGTKFAYGGDEVEASVWDAELAFQALKGAEEGQLGKKRKKGATLFPAELWRAKNVANDTLGLRQPVRITSLAFLDPDARCLIAGTELGDARRYDTRTGRRPVAEFKLIGRTGGVRVVEKGANDNEVFISDNGSNLFSIDLRNGKIAYSYKGLSGSVNAIAVTPKLLATTALDRFARIHSVCPPPELSGKQQDNRGSVLEKVFTKSIPTCIVWDGASTTCGRAYEDNDDIWENMEHIADESESDMEGSVRIKHRKK